jgi:hypothetical protein
MVAISLLDVIFTAVQVPFPVPMRLKFHPEHETMPIAPVDPFLGGSVAYSPF